MSAERTLNSSKRQALIDEVRDAAARVEEETMWADVSYSPEFVALLVTAQSKEGTKAREEIHLRRMAAAYMELVATASVASKSEAYFWLRAIGYVSHERGVIRSFADNLDDAPRPYKAAIADMVRLVPDMHEAA